MDSAKVLPLRCAHLRARLRRARRILGEKRNEQIINFHREESAKFVKPEGPVDALWWFRELDRDLAVNRDHRVRSFGFRKVVVQGFEMLLELERGVELGMLALDDCRGCSVLFTYLRQWNQWRAECHISRSAARPNPARRAIILCRHA